MQSFMVTFSRKRTYSGFQTSLVTAVKYFVIINFGCVDLSGLQVDIWGDGAEIGWKNITIFAFRILNKPTICPKSVQSLIILL